MAQGRYIGLDRGQLCADALRLPGADGLSAPCLCDPMALAAIAAPGPFYVAGFTVAPVDHDWREYAAAAWPDLRRGMIVTVHRPWGTVLNGAPLAALLASRIRAHSTRIIRRAHPQAPEATESHAMIYAGGGWCWSQDHEFKLAHLREYTGCVLTFWHMAWTPNQRDHLVAECAPHNGKGYGYRDIAAIWAWAVSGREDWIGALGDRAHWICSESVVELVRASVYADFGGDCPAVELIPQRLANWMLANGFRPLALRFV